MRPTLWILALIFAGCGLAAPRTGEVLTQGVARARFEVRANGTDVVKVAVFFPAGDDGSPRAGPHPAVVFIQGGFVDAERYAWQAVALAARGYVVAVPENTLQLAFFSIDHGQAARGLLTRPPPGSLLEGLVAEERIAVAGHSLGSVVAAKLALEGGFAALALEAGFPDTADVSKLTSFTRPSLSLAGALDCSAKVDAVRTGWASLPTPTALVVLAGVTHYQFTDAQTEDEKSGCTPEATLDDAHARISGALVGFLDAALSTQGLGADALRAVPGATVEVR